MCTRSDPHARIPMGTADSENEEDEEEEQRRQKRHEHAFDLKRYWLDFAHHSVVVVYRTLLMEYRRNTPRTNHILITFFTEVQCRAAVRAGLPPCSGWFDVR